MPRFGGKVEAGLHALGGPRACRDDLVDAPFSLLVAWVTWPPRQRFPEPRALSLNSRIGLVKRFAPPRKSQKMASTFSMKCEENLLIQSVSPLLGV